MLNDEWYENYRGVLNITLLALGIPYDEIQDKMTSIILDKPLISIDALGYPEETPRIDCKKEYLFPVNNASENS